MMSGGNTCGSEHGHSPHRRTVLMGLCGLGLSACQQMPLAQPENSGSWSSAPALPVALQEIYPALHLGKIHLAGGFVAEGGRITGPTATHVAFDPTTNSWTPQPDLPRQRHHPHLVSFQGYLLAFGGFESPSSDRVWEMQASGFVLMPEDGRSVDYPPLKAVNEDWGALPTLPRPVGEAVTGVVDNVLHVAGGRRPSSEANANWGDHFDADDHFVLDSIGGAWETAAPLPTARNSAAAAMIGKDWHVVGGRTVAGGNTGAHEVYDAREDRWRAAAPMPQGQGGLAAASVGEQLYAFGGEYFSPEPGGVYPEAWRYSRSEDTWQAVPDMPSPRHGLGAVALADQIYVIGGALGVGGRDTSSIMEIYRP